MVTTGANPKLAIVMADLKNDFGKSVSEGILGVAGKLFSPTGEKIEKAVRQGYYNSIKSMVSSQCHNEQK
ncbi:MAG TPA: hypothetical protein VHQ24_01510 [Lachnospiraceae bacterium]|nr:hypothetical protein [Lachnospiraceae bacterium]